MKTLTMKTLAGLAAPYFLSSALLPAGGVGTGTLPAGLERSPLSSFYIAPTRIAWQSEGGVQTAGSLLEPNAGQAVLAAPVPPCVLTTSSNSSAGVLLDFGTERQGYIEIFTPLTPEQTKPRRVRVRFGESVSEAMAELSGKKSAQNDHAIRDEVATHAAFAAGLKPAGLRTEWLVNPLGIDAAQPRLSWRVESDTRGQRQTAYQIRVATALDALRSGKADAWDSGKVASDETLNSVYAGKPLASGQPCFWQVKVWDRDGQESSWSAPASWSMGLLKPDDWKAQWIAFKDTSPLHKDRQTLQLPPARHYRKLITLGKPVKRATLYGSALGLVEFHLNGQRVGDSLFEPGWADYHQRVHYRTHDVTKWVRLGGNAVGAIVSDGWYAGYVGYGLLVGYGPNKTGRNFYGKTPALLAQLEIEYADGSREVIGTDATWQVSGDGPIREADLIMGERFEARRDDADWCVAAAQIRKSAASSDWKWESAIRAEDNGSVKAKYFEPGVERELELGFQRPPKLQAYAAPPIRVTQELKARRITEPKPGVYLFDLGQNFAGVARLKVKAPAGTKIQMRFGEMLHPDGRLMTENLRRARATDCFVCRGDRDGETWSPRFTYHGFQFVEVTELPSRPSLDTITGLVLHNDTPLTSSFACSDPLMTQFWKNTQWTQRANFVEIPTDCPQRDERLGWMGDAQVYVRTASFNADVAAFFTKWLDDLEESQRISGPSAGAYPDYAPYPMAHGKPGATHGTASTDAGIICPWTIWQVYGDTRVIERHWASMTRFMDWRKKASPDFRGVSLGNTWGDWLNVNETTPIEYVDAVYFAYSAKLMAEMAGAIGRRDDADAYRKLLTDIRAVFQRDYVQTDGTLKVDTQTAYVLALWMGLLPELLAPQAAAALAAKLEKNGFRMSTGYVPAKEIESVTEGGRALAKAVGVKFIRTESGYAMLAVESGSYHFQSKR